MAEPCYMSINLVSGPTRSTFHSIVLKAIQIGGFESAELDALDLLVYGGTRWTQSLASLMH